MAPPMRRIRARPRPSRGFTLVEIMVVVILVAIVSAIVLPNLTGAMGTTRLESAARQISDVMDYCYRASASTGRVYGLIFDHEGKSFQVLTEGDDDSGEEPVDESGLKRVKLPGMMESPLPDGVKLDDAKAFEEGLLKTEDERVRILFFPDGTTEFANLTFADESGAKRVVKLNGLSGTVKIVTPGPDDDEDANQDWGEDLDEGSR